MYTRVRILWLLRNKMNFVLNFVERMFPTLYEKENEEIDEMMRSNEAQQYVQEANYNSDEEDDRKEAGIKSKVTEDIMFENFPDEIYYDASSSLTLTEYENNVTNIEKDHLSNNEEKSKIQNLSGSDRCHSFQLVDEYDTETTEFHWSDCDEGESTADYKMLDNNESKIKFFWANQYDGISSNEEPSKFGDFSSNAKTVELFDDQNFDRRAEFGPIESSWPQRCLDTQGEENEVEKNLNIETTVGQGSGVASSTSPFNSNLSCRPDGFPVLSSPFSLNSRWSASHILNANNGDLDSIEKAASLHRSSAVHSEANCTWSGSLPPRDHTNPTYSCKVFLGGVPYDITEDGLIDAFAPFGRIEIVWPQKVGRSVSNSSKAGYNYIIFESEKQVKALLQACTHDYNNRGNWYFKISSRRWRSRKVQIIPWVISDNTFVHSPSESRDLSKTVFVGALHGTLTAKGLALVMNELFGGVVYADLDTDRHKYPIGSGLVAFNNHKSYMKAISAAFIEIKTPRFKKKVQCDPYIEDAICSTCQVEYGPIFCRDAACFRYFCRSCWQWRHSHAVDTSLSNHKPMMRKRQDTTSTRLLCT